MIPLRQKVGQPLLEVLCRNGISQLVTQVRNLLRIVLGGQANRYRSVLIEHGLQVFLLRERFHKTNSRCLVAEMLVKAMGLLPMRPAVHDDRLDSTRL